MKKLSWTGLLLSSGLLIATVPACAGDDGDGGNGDGDGDGTGTGGSDAGSGGNDTGAGGSDTSAGGSDTSSGGSDTSSGGSDTGSGGDDTGSGGDGAGSGGDDAGSGGDDAGTGGDDGTGGDGGDPPSVECTAYCEAWTEKDCNESADVSAGYDDEAACLAACATMNDDGLDDAADGDSVQCRITHLGFSTGADAHCGHAQGTPTAPCN